MVYDRKTQTITHTTFKNILDFLPKNLSIFLNDTKVIKARIFGKKQTGGKIELLFNKPLPNNQYLVYMRGKVLVGNIISFDLNLKVEVLKLQEDGSRVVEFYQDDNQLDFLSLVEILNTIGHLPLPPYIKRESGEKDISDYQTVFAKKEGAVAAPTAGLHFTEQLISEIEAIGVEIVKIVLHVGIGTFRPVKVEEIKDHQMHNELYEISEESALMVNKAIVENRRVIAVGTTSIRTLESGFKDGKVVAGSGDTEIFIYPGYKFKVIDGLITNFHLPKSTLLMLVASFVGLKIAQELYAEAIKEKYRFYSYGDAMLII